MRRALHLGRTAYFQFQIEIVDVVNIPYPQGRFLVKWNYKNGILSPKEAEQHAAAHNSKSAPDLSHPDPPHHNPKFTAREHLAPSNSSVAASSIASSMNSVDVPFDPTPEDDESPEAHHRPAKESTSKLLTHNDRIGFTPSVKVNRSHSAEYRYILKCSVAIPVRDNKLVASDVKFSVRHQYQVRGKWETSKLGECQINLAQHAHKEWMPSQEHRSGTGSRLRSDYASIAESVTYRNQIQRFLLQNGKTNALLRLKVDCQFIGGQPYRAPTQKCRSLCFAFCRSLKLM